MADLAAKLGGAQQDAPQDEPHTARDTGFMADLTAKLAGEQEQRFEREGPRPPGRCHMLGPDGRYSMQGSGDGFKGWARE